MYTGRSNHMIAWPHRGDLLPIATAVHKNISPKSAACLQRPTETVARKRAIAASLEQAPHTFLSGHEGSNEGKDK